MKSKNEIRNKLKEGHFYKNSKTDEPIMIEADLEDKAMVSKFVSNLTKVGSKTLSSVSFICDKKDIVPLEVTEENLFKFGFILPSEWIFYCDLNSSSGKTSVKLGPNFYLIYKTDSGIHEIQERYNIKLTLRRL